MITNSDVKKYVENQKGTLKHIVSCCVGKPRLSIIQLGDNPASNSYIKGKTKDAAEIGIECNVIKLPEDTSESSLLDIIDQQNKEPTVSGIIVQLPLPEHINVKNVQLTISPYKDVDGFHPLSPFKPCTPTGVINFLDYIEYDFAGKNISVIGRSENVGLPLAKMAMEKDATVTIFHSKSNIERLMDMIQKSDMVFFCMNKPEYFDGNLIGEAEFDFIDIGLERSYSDGKLCGNIERKTLERILQDPDRENKIRVSGTGGVGLLTRLQLMQNVISASAGNKIPVE